MTYWYTTFGRVEVKEIVLEEFGKSVRPFLRVSDITPRSCSMPLQRRLTDFSADVPFHDVPKKLQEHYGFALSQEVIRKIALEHASRMSSFVKEAESLSDNPGVEKIIAQADGGMIPIVEIDEASTVKDKRKTRKVLWKEARLCFSRDTEKIGAVFRATLKSTESLGDIWFSSAVEAGMGSSTTVHCIGDGATWIKDQADRVFANQGSYLIDFYHVSEYLAAAAKECDKEDPDKWRKEQQINLKEGNLYLVLQELEKLLYKEELPEKSATDSCYRYLTKRLYQLDYLGAIMNDLPIGSGEIESGHRHVVQKRMKRAGSWWKENNAEKMLQLLTVRANNQWDSYWKIQREGFLEEAA